YYDAQLWQSVPSSHVPWLNTKEDRRSQLQRSRFVQRHQGRQAVLGAASSRQRDSTAIPVQRAPSTANADGQATRLRAADDGAAALARCGAWAKRLHGS